MASFTQSAQGAGTTRGPGGEMCVRLPLTGQPIGLPSFAERGFARPLWGAVAACSDARMAAKPRTQLQKVVCEDCFFRRNMLCALVLDEPCATYRPDTPEGLRPPQQLRFEFRQERRTKAAWAFPTAQEQAALHAR